MPRPPPPPTATYRGLGYRLVEVPRGGVAERVAFGVAEACR
jgi:predicted ATPase